MRIFVVDDGGGGGTTTTKDSSILNIILSIKFVMKTRCSECQDMKDAGSPVCTFVKRVYKTKKYENGVEEEEKLSLIHISEPTRPY